jgi:hypothetical protein
VDKEWGVIIHLPSTGEPECSLQWIDLEAGYGGLIYASGLMEYRKLKVLTPMLPGGMVPDRKAVMLPEAPEWMEPEDTAPQLTLVQGGADAAPPAMAVAPEPANENGVKVDLTLDAQVYAWLVARMQRIGALYEDGNQGPALMLVKRWPSTVPQPLPDTLSPVQVEDLATQLDIIEREYQLPFGDPRPGVVGKPTRPKPEAKPARKATPVSKAVAKAAAKRTTNRKTTNKETGK